MTQRNMYIILNKHAASGNAARNWPKLEKLLKQKNISYSLQITKSPEDGISLSKNYGDNLSLNNSNQEILVVIGGDGTLNQCLTGIKLSKNPNTAIAYIPFGTGNDFARGLNINRDFKSLLKLADNNLKSTDINIGRFYNKNDKKYRYFVNNIGIGLDARIVYAANHSKSKNILNKFHLGKFSYLSQLVKALIQQNTFNVNLYNNLDDKEYEIKNTFFASITNHAYFGGGVPIAPGASPYESNLDLLIVKKTNIFKIFKLFIQIFTNGQHINSPSISHYKLNNFSINIDNKQYLQMDGEDFFKCNLDLDFSVESHSFYIVQN